MLWIAVIIAALIAVFFVSKEILANYYANRGIELVRNNNFEEAKNPLERSLFFSSNNSVAHFFLGLAYLGPHTPIEVRKEEDNPFPQADYSLAARHLDAAIALGLEGERLESYRLALELSGLAHQRIGNKDVSLERYLKLIEEFPEASFWARYAVANEYFYQYNKPEEALDILIEAPDDLRAETGALFKIYTLLARLSLFLEKFDDAKKYAELSVESAGGRSDLDVQISHIILATTDILRGDDAGAERHVAEADRLSGSTDTFSCFVAQAHWMAKNYKEALEIIEGAGRPKNDFAYQACLANKAKSLHALGRTAEAKLAANEFLDLVQTLYSQNVFIRRDMQVAQEILGGN